MAANLDTPMDSHHTELKIEPSSPTTERDLEDPQAHTVSAVKMEPACSPTMKSSGQVQSPGDHIINTHAPVIPDCRADQPVVVPPADTEKDDGTNEPPRGVPEGVGTKKHPRATGSGGVGESEKGKPSKKMKTLKDLSVRRESVAKKARLNPRSLRQRYPKSAKFKKATEGNLLGVPVTYRNPFICGICAHTFASAANLLNHLKCHRDAVTHPCAICPKSFKSRSHMVDHVITHSNQRPHRCQTCGKTFKRHRHRDAHMKVCGEKQRPSKVDMDVMQHKKSNVKEHDDKNTALGERLIPNTNASIGGNAAAKSPGGFYDTLLGEPEESYRCTICEKRFRTRHAVVWHMDTHTGDLPFRCIVCEERFADEAALSAHAQASHPEAPHACDVCEERFAEPEGLKSHRKFNHGKDGSFCVIN